MSYSRYQNILLVLCLFVFFMVPEFASCSPIEGGQGESSKDLVQEIETLRTCYLSQIGKLENLKDFYKTYSLLNDANCWAEGIQQIHAFNAHPYTQVEREKMELIREILLNRFSSKSEEIPFITQLNQPLIPEQPYSLTKALKLVIYHNIGPLTLMGIGVTLLVLARY